MNLLANSIVVTVNRLVVVEQTTTKSSILSVEFKFKFNKICVTFYFLFQPVSLA